MSLHYRDRGYRWTLHRVLSRGPKMARVIVRESWTGRDGEPITTYRETRLTLGEADRRLARGEGAA